MSLGGPDTARVERPWRLRCKWAASFCAARRWWDGVGHKVWALPFRTRLILRVHRGETARPPGSSPSGTTTAGWRGSGISMASHPVSTGRLTPSIRDHPRATRHGCCSTSSDEPEMPVDGREGNIRCSLSLRPTYTVVGGESCRVSYEERGAISMQSRYPKVGESR